MYSRIQFLVAVRHWCFDIFMLLQGSARVTVHWDAGVPGGGAAAATLLQPVPPARTPWSVCEKCNWPVVTSMKSSYTISLERVVFLVLANTKHAGLIALRTIKKYLLGLWGYEIHQCTPKLCYCGEYLCSVCWCFRELWKNFDGYCGVKLKLHRNVSVKDTDGTKATAGKQRLSHF